MLSLLSLAAALPLAQALLTAEQATDCDCYRSRSESSSHIFSNHLVQDFRNLSSWRQTDKSLADPDTGVPHLIGDPDKASKADLTSKYFADDELWAGTWGLQTWDNGYPSTANGGDPTLLMVNSKNNVYIERDPNASLDGDDGYETFLTLRTARHKKFQSTAEFESLDRNYLHLSMRMYARTIGDDGACTAMFTYLLDSDDSDDVQEADVEFLTSGPRDVVQYTNQPGDIGETKNVTMDVDMGEWAEHRLDWTAGRAEWFINGALVATLKKNPPRDPAMVIFNSWSNGGSWTGVMDVNGTAQLQIQWLEIAYNTTATATDLECANTCDVDAGGEGSGGDGDGGDDDAGGVGGNDDNDSAGVRAAAWGAAVVAQTALLGAWAVLL